MAKPVTARSSIAGLLVALFAVLLMVGPVADGFVCAADGLDDAPPAAAQTAATPVKAEAAPTALPAPRSEAPGLCQHGHSHVTGTPAEQSVAGRLIRLAHKNPLYPLPSQAIRFRLASGLDRPPRV